MPQVCTVCTHARREEIDRAIAGRDGSMRAIAKRYGVVASSLKRHVVEHVPAAVVKAAERSAVKHGRTLLSRVEDLVGTIESTLHEALEAKDLRAAAALIRESRGSLELIGRLTGELQENAVFVLLQRIGIQTLEDAERWVGERERLAQLPLGAIADNAIQVLQLYLREAPAERDRVRDALFSERRVEAA